MSYQFLYGRKITHLNKVRLRGYGKTSTFPVEAILDGLKQWRQESPLHWVRLKSLAHTWKPHEQLTEKKSKQHFLLLNHLGMCIYISTRYIKREVANKTNKSFFPILLWIKDTGKKPGEGVEAGEGGGDGWGGGTVVGSKCRQLYLTTMKYIFLKKNHLYSKMPEQV